MHVLIYLYSLSMEIPCRIHVASLHLGGSISQSDPDLESDSLGVTLTSATTMNSMALDSMSSPVTTLDRERVGHRDHDHSLRWSLLFFP